MGTAHQRQRHRPSRIPRALLVVGTSAQASAGVDMVATRAPLPRARVDTSGRASAGASEELVQVLEGVGFAGALVLAVLLDSGEPQRETSVVGR